MESVRYSAEEIVARGKEIYEKRFRKSLEPQHTGEFLVIDIETGEFEMDADDLTAALKAYDKNPGGARYQLRIGYETSGTIGNAQSEQSR